MKSVRIYTPIFKKREDFSGLRFGRLLVKHLIGSYKNKHYWHCACDCGGMSEVSTSSLKNGNTTSCGCLAIENSVKKSKNHWARTELDTGIGQ